MSGAGKCDSFSGGSPDRAVKGGGGEGGRHFVFRLSMVFSSKEKIHPILNQQKRVIIVRGIQTARRNRVNDTTPNMTFHLFLDLDFRLSRKVRASHCHCNAATVLGSIPASADTVEPEERQMKQR
jgi:hypothetical protein